MGLHSLTIIVSWQVVLVSNWKLTAGIAQLQQLDRHRTRSSRGRRRPLALPAPACILDMLAAEAFTRAWPASLRLGSRLRSMRLVLLLHSTVSWLRLYRHFLLTKEPLILRIARMK